MTMRAERFGLGRQNLRDEVRSRRNLQAEKLSRAVEVESPATMYSDSQQKFHRSEIQSGPRLMCRSSLKRRRRHRNPPARIPVLRRAGAHSELLPGNGGLVQSNSTRL